MNFSRGMVRDWFDIDIYDDIDMVVDELNSVPGVTSFYGDTGVLLVDSFCEEHRGINSLVVLVEENFRRKIKCLK